MSITLNIVKSRLNQKLAEYTKNRDKAKFDCDKQKFGDLSFQAELEDNRLLDSENKLLAVRDVINHVLRNED